MFANPSCPYSMTTFLPTVRERATELIGITLDGVGVRPAVARVAVAVVDLLHE